jgi:hypothetical protein
MKNKPYRVNIKVDELFYKNFLDKNRKKTENIIGLKFKSVPQFTNFLMSNAQINIKFHNIKKLK